VNVKEAQAILEVRARQQEIVARLGQQALAGIELTELFDRAVTNVAQTLEVEYCKILELLPEGDELILRAGTGWEPGHVGYSTVSASVETQAGHTLLSDEPIIIEDWLTETRFKRSRMLQDHEVRSGLSVVIAGETKPFGVLSADTSRKRQFTQDDIYFLQAVANVLAAAIERKQAELSQRILAEAAKALAASLDYEQCLSKVAWLAVPHLADWCSVDLIEPDQSIRHVTVAHVDPTKVELAHELQHRYPPNWNNSNNMPQVFRTGQSEFFPEITEAMLEAAAHDAEHYRILRDLQMKSAMVVPLSTRGQVLGVMTFVWVESNRRYTEADLHLAEELARRAAMAIDNARLYQAEQQARQAAEQSTRRTAGLQAVTAALVETLTPKQVAQVIIEQGLALIEADSGLMALIDSRSHHLKIVHHFGYADDIIENWRQIPLATPTPLTDTVRIGEPLFLESPKALTARYPGFQFRDLPTHQAFVSLPLTIKGKTEGVIGLGFSRAHNFSDEERAFMLNLAGQGTQALERARLYQAERETRRTAQRALKHLTSLQRITTALARALTPAQVSRVIIEQGIATLKADSGLIALLDETGEYLEILDWFGYKDEAIESWQQFPLAAHVPLAEAARMGQAVFIDNPEMLQARYPEFAAQRKSDHNSMVSLPLTVENRVVGVIGLSFTRAGKFGQETRDFMMALARQCAQALERARLYEVERQARVKAEAARRTEALLVETRERNRLAQELHDNVAQALGYLNLKIATVNMLLAEGKSENVEANLNELKQIVGEAYTDVREEIFNLRSSASPGVEFLATLQDYIAKYKRFYDLEVRLIREADKHHFEFPDEVGIQLIRTIQEALMNVRKHAQVNEAIIRLEREGQQVRLSVEDQGQGFDATQRKQEGVSNFGLQIMRERIEKVGGRMEIKTAPGQGTQIILTYSPEQT
jgi:GAF domain-containing protein